MLKPTLVFIVCVALALSALTLFFVLFRSHSHKKNYFVLMQLMVILYLFGYLIEITATTAEEAFAGVKVLYVGSNFVAVFAFFFTADYCNVKLHPLWIKTPMTLLAAAAILSMWTTKFHGLIYADYSLQTYPTNNLFIVPGPLYALNHSYPSLCMIMVIVFILYQIKKWKDKYKKQLQILMFCTFIPFAAEGIYFITSMLGVNKYQLYFTPHSIAIMSFLLYLLVLRFNMFEIISTATATAMEHIQEGFVLVDENDNYLFSNSAAFKVFPEITKLLKGEFIFLAQGWPAELKGISGGSVDFSISDSGLKYYTASVSPVLDESENLAAKIILFREITDSVNLLKELENAAYIDALTGLYNRKHFTELANTEIERAQRAGKSIYTVMLDLDFFKLVNDTYGHNAGDLILKQAAAIMRQTIRTYDLLGRYGGEEFVLLITDDLDAPEALRLMERIRENMADAVTEYEGAKIKVTCSIGLAAFSGNDTLETAVKHADEALYAAKHSGRNRVKVYGGD